MNLRPRRQRRDDSGVSSVELVLYMPLLMLVILIAVQFSLVWFGNQAASAVARETARTARVYPEDRGRAYAEGYQYAANIGQGVLEDPKITVTPIGDGRVRVTVTGHAQEIVPGLAPEVSQTVEGPLEEFQDDAP
ncbi:TadE/TadG family type IV pilus assembly protein [Nocardioides sp. HM23]|uniref:TadE/TadG family type IV pilus assembly protein n=1 Tax=Nocardioides bizhenqiangii TaxID=3095076 RepID=UPI002ACA2C0A|nr:TadE/TadG family type IV pilus assembly protein [Nocardioides sp. HM23]MDZ5621567.1 TadE/TadG family type IV pilus assembly protein [Nocardioides sp. HM23]